MSERRGKGFPGVSVTLSTVMGLRKFLPWPLPSPWEQKTGGHLGVTDTRPPTRARLSGLPLPSPRHHSSVPLSTSSPDDSLAKWGVNQATSQFGGPELTPQWELRGEGRDHHWETRGLTLSPQPLAKALSLLVPQFPDL